MRSRKSIIPLFIALTMMKATAAHAQRLDDIVDIITFAWSHGEARALVAMGGRDGISIETPDGRMGPLGARQAAAVLRKMFDDRETVSIRPGMTQIVGGSPRRAFSEITWITRAPNTTQQERLTVFLELVQENDRWYITQIRLLP